MPYALCLFYAVLLCRSLADAPAQKTGRQANAYESSQPPSIPSAAFHSSLSSSPLLLSSPLLSSPLLLSSSFGDSSSSNLRSLSFFLSAPFSPFLFYFLFYYISWLGLSSLTKEQKPPGPSHLISLTIYIHTYGTVHTKYIHTVEPPASRLLVLYAILPLSAIPLRYTYTQCTIHYTVDQQRPARSQLLVRHPDYSRRHHRCIDCIFCIFCIVQPYRATGYLGDYLYPLSR